MKKRFLALFLVASVAAPLSAEVISGIVIDSADATPIGQVLVSVNESASITTQTSAEGKFTLDFTTSLAAHLQTSRPSVVVKIKKDAISWRGSGEIALQIVDIRGKVRARFSSQAHSVGASYSIAHLPNGFYLVRVLSAGVSSSFPLLNVRDGLTEHTHSMNNSSEPTALAKAAAISLKFSKQGYATRIITVTGSQSNLQVKMKKTAEDSAGSGTVVENILPKKSVRIGTFTVGFRGNNNKKGAAMAKFAAAYYTRNSRGKLEVTYTGTGQGNYVFKVDTKRKHNNVGGLSSYQKDVATHELGHKLGLGHCKTQLNNTTKKGQDRTSIMNGVAVYAPYLVAPQYYVKGWLPEEEVVLFDGSSNIFELKKISDFEGDGLSAVVITPAMWNKLNPGVGAPLFVSFGWNRKYPDAKTFAVHKAYGGGTVLMAQKRDYYIDKKQTGIEIRVLDNPDPKKMTVSITLGHRD